MTLTKTDALARLIDAHATAAGATHDAQADLIASIQLALSSLLKAEWIDTAPAHPLQVAVFGPTQSGKSTVVNLLLGVEATSVSALAGHTVHAQAFHQGHAESEPLAAFFDGYQMATPDTLDPEVLRAWSSAAVPGGVFIMSVWDTPDFDSLCANTYIDAVARTVALADVLVLAVSKDKYADHRVWQWLDLVAPLGKPLVVCVNKVDEASREPVGEAILARLAKHAIGKLDPPVVLMPWFEASAGAPALEVSALQRAVLDAARRARDDSARTGVDELISVNWTAWTEPLVAELGARSTFLSELDNAADQMMSRYRADFLEHPDHYETFQHSLAEMLQLLEVPGLAGVLGHTRRLVTWPMRKVFGIARQRTGTARPQSYELSLLQDQHREAIAALLESAISLAAEGGERANWWHATSQSLRRQREVWQADFDDAAAQYRRDFEPEIQAAARQLYAGLQDQPAVLNSLRAARFTADAAGVAFAVKTGGVGLADLAIAPAMLSVTSLLTESALGTYIDTVMNTLRSRQFDAVKTRLVDAQFSDTLRAAVNALEGPGLYRVDSDEFSALAEALEQRI